MRGIILAAGRGARMGDLTDNKPKCLIEVGGRTLLDWQISALRGAGVDRIAIVTGWQGEQLASYGTELFENLRWAETNMVMSLACATLWLNADRCVVSYSDIFYRSTAMQALLKAPGDIAITYDPDWLQIWSRRFENPLTDAETFRIDNAGKIIEIGGRPSSINEIKGQFMGLLRFDPNGWATVENIVQKFPKKIQDKLDMTGLLQHLIAAGVVVHGVPTNGPWGEIDSVSDLMLYEADFRQGTLRK